MTRTNLTRALFVVAAAALCVAALPQMASAEVVNTGALLQGDPICVHRAGCYERVHGVKLTAGTKYTITLTSAAFDTYLFLENSQGQLLAFNDDYPGLGTNSRIIFTPSASGTYNLVVSSYLQGATGGYTLTVTP
jgi:hypothetical protein